ncbi:hypothetical protein ADK86_06070 [Streptomyces sp. NRRL F-5755]|nr:hypothetical protein ADK86_06070 [Streptomyces sp. NRRL F-5755]
MVAQGEMRHFAQEAAGGPLSTPGSVRRLEQVAVPRQLGPCFSTAVDAPVVPGTYAQSAGHEMALEKHQLLARLGTDRGYGRRRWAGSCRKAPAATTPRTRKRLHGCGTA